MDGAYNQRNPAVKRLMREALELKDPTELYFAQPLEDNLFEWHFTVRGPPDTDFADGIYHGRILLPTEYPMKPPSIMILTPNGRFELNKKICLSISGYHPESWQPSWSIRTALLAIIGFMPTPGVGALGSLDYSAEERKVLARKSQEWKCNVCKIKMSEVLPPLTEASLSTRAEAQQLASQIDLKNETENQAEQKTEVSNAIEKASVENSLKQNTLPAQKVEEKPKPSDSESQQVDSQASNRPATENSPAESMPESITTGSTNETQTVRQRLRNTPVRPPTGADFIPRPAPIVVQRSRPDFGGAAITCSIWLITIFLFALFFRRLYVTNGGFFGPPEPSYQDTTSSSSDGQ